MGDLLCESFSPAIGGTGRETESLVPQLSQSQVSIF